MRVKIVVNGSNVQQIDDIDIWHASCKVKEISSLLCYDDCLQSFDHHVISMKDKWSQKEDEILRASVRVLGLSNWFTISSEWFDSSKSSEDCRERWEHLSSLTTQQTNFNRNRIPSVNSLYEQMPASISRDDIAETELHHEAIFKSLTVRRRRELEAIEERRLFGKASRSVHDKQLIQRAYLVGMNGVKKILRMNGVHQKEQCVSSKISFLSIMVEMEKVSQSEVDTSMKQMMSLIKKLPIRVKELKDEHIISPIHTRPISIMKGAKGLCCSNDMVNLTSAELPIGQVLESARIQIRREVNDDGDQGLVHHNVAKQVSSFSIHNNKGSGINHDYELIKFVSPSSETFKTAINIPSCFNRLYN